MSRRCFSSFLPSEDESFTGLSLPRTSRKATFGFLSRRRLLPRRSPKGSPRRDPLHRDPLHRDPLHQRPAPPRKTLSHPRGFKTLSSRSSPRTAPRPFI